MAHVRFKVDGRTVSKELAEKIQRLQRELSETQRLLRLEYEKSPEYRAAVAVASQGSVGVVVARDGYLDVAVPCFDYSSEGRRKPTSYLGETTINMLLNGKLLTDGQKRALLAERFGGLFDQANVRVLERRWELVELDADRREVRRLALCDTEEQAEEKLQDWCDFDEEFEAGVWRGADWSDVEFVLVREVWL